MNFPGDRSILLYRSSGSAENNASMALKRSDLQTPVFFDLVVLRFEDAAIEATKRNSQMLMCSEAQPEICEAFLRLSLS